MSFVDVLNIIDEFFYKLFFDLRPAIENLLQIRDIYVLHIIGVPLCLCPIILVLIKVVKVIRKIY